ncbi:hypothetical protein [Nisaea sediminum]|uniref:hypothetical protein n=1 Tax=Nisaea sediminum TaxID=2775867 RepID=UPI001868B0F1|nr:hypothetical protein [Nisaea sediminum]
MKTFETYLTDAERNGCIDHRLRLQRGPGGEVRFDIHPVDRDGETLDLEVAGNSLAPFFNAEVAELLEIEGFVTKEDIEEIKRLIRAGLPVPAAGLSRDDVPEPEGDGDTRL